MSVWLFNSAATAIHFTTAGMTGLVGATAFPGPIAVWPGTSYYANGSFNFYFGATRGLVNEIKFGSTNVSTAAKTVVGGTTTALGLGTQGVTGVFTAKFLHPESFFAPYSALVECTCPKYTTITVSIHDGIIYGWQDSAGYQAVNQWGYPAPITTTPGVDVETFTGVGVIENATSLRATAGITGTLTYYVTYDIYFPSSYTSVYYKRIDLVLSCGLIQSMTITPGSLYYYWTHS